MRYPLVTRVTQLNPPVTNASAMERRMSPQGQKRPTTKKSSQKTQNRVPTSDSSAKNQAEARLMRPRERKPGHLNSGCRTKRTCEKP